MSLLQGVLRQEPAVDSRRIHDSDESDDDLVNVISLPGTPDRTRPSSPVRGAASRPLKGPLHLVSGRRDPLRALPTEILQRIFALLSTKDLAKCALVSKKWNRSQTINYIWFRHYRKENFRDESLPPGKWTKRESKQIWRVVHLKADRERASVGTTFSRRSECPSPVRSGYQTPKEIKEEQWRKEAEGAAKPGKGEMREMYKELDGRKARGKSKFGNIRDKGGWDEQFQF